MNTHSDLPPSPVPSAAPWRTGRRLLVATAALATLLALGYTVENWRGERAWEESRRSLEVKGEVLDWNAFIPAPVPDDQNFYKAPRMREWFVREHFAIGGEEPANAPKPFALAPHPEADLMVAELEVLPPDAVGATPAATPEVRWEDPTGPERAAGLLQSVLGPYVIGPRACILLARPLDQIKPLHLRIGAATVPTSIQLAAFLAGAPTTNATPKLAGLPEWKVTALGANRFRVFSQAPAYNAEEYLRWTDSVASDFDQVRQAVQRPYARIDCDYQYPFAIHIPNFVRLRTVVQLLAQRAQSFLLLGQPEAAWRELSLVYDVNQVLLAKPSGKPLTLVGAMIHVAIAGLYTGVVKDGLRLHAWREPQLLALESQLKATDLLVLAEESLREERAATCRTIEITPRRELAKMIGNSISAVALTCMPRGWLYQNMAVGAQAEQVLLGSADPQQQLIHPRQLGRSYHELEAKVQRTSPYSFLVAQAVPNFLRALQTIAYNQTMVNQARLGCALERFRLANGQFPETLSALTPRFLAQPPHDLVGGQPLQYRRQGEGYRLYSIGWNETDDGGLPASSREQGDWVWAISVAPAVP